MSRQAGDEHSSATIEMAEAGVRVYDAWAKSDTDHSMNGIVHPASGLVVEVYQEMERVRLRRAGESPNR